MQLLSVCIKKILSKCNAFEIDSNRSLGKFESKKNDLNKYSTSKKSSNPLFGRSFEIGYNGFPIYNIITKEISNIFSM